MYATTAKPYELLIRWGVTGELTGAQVQKRLVTTNSSGAVVGEMLQPAEPLALTGGEGFPLADVLSQAQIDAVVTTAKAIQARDAAIAERDAALSRVAELEAIVNGLSAAKE